MALGGDESSFLSSVDVVMVAAWELLRAVKRQKRQQPNHGLLATEQREGLEGKGLGKRNTRELWSQGRVTE